LGRRRGDYEECHEENDEKVKITEDVYEGSDKAYTDEGKRG
jgi:hypothetical protein